MKVSLRSSRFLSPAALTMVALTVVLAGRSASGDKGIAVEPRAPDGSVVEGRVWLLVIGINKYSLWPSLQGSVPDARGVKEVLQSRYLIDVVIELYDQQATYEGIESALRRLKEELKPEDSLVIYYSGHGHLDPALNAGFWIPHDADLKSSRSWFSDDVIKKFLQGLPSRHVLLISDSCFSGDFVRASPRPPREPEDKYYRRVYSRRSRKALTSGSLEPVADVALGGHSPFAYFVIDALKSNKQPYMTPSDLFAVIKVAVAHNSEQEPRYGYIKDAGDGDGEFIFFLKKGKPPEPRLDREKPTIDILEPEQFRGLNTRGLKVEARNDATTLTLRGIAKDNEGVTAVRLNRDALPLTPASERGLAVVGWQGSRAVEFSATIHLDPGEKKNVRLEAQDGAGNLATMVLTFELPQLPEPKKPERPPATTPQKQADNARGYDFVRIPAGEGLAEFEIGKNDVTVAQFRRFVEATGYKTTAETQGWSFGWTGSGFDKTNGLTWQNGTSLKDKAEAMHPVVHVSWEDAKAFCEWMGGRLPSDEEWEHAARGGLQGKDFVWGDEFPPPPGSGNFADEAARRKYNWGHTMDGYDDGYADTSPVGSYKPNGYGVYDMAGNVWQWVDKDAGNGAHRCRGSSFYHASYPFNTRIDFRLNYDAPYYLVGFRVARTLK